MAASKQAIEVVSVGDVAADLIISLRNYPARGGDAEVPSIRREPGGSAANFAVGVSRLGMRSGFLGKIGSDPTGKYLYEDLNREGVDISHLRVTDVETATVVVLVERSGRRTMLSFRGASTKLTASEIPQDYVSAARWLHVSGYALIHRPQRDAALRAMTYAEEANIKTSLDPSPHIHLAKPDVVTRALKLTHVLFPNYREAQYLSGRSNIREAGKRLLKRGPSLVSMKLGRRGCLLMTNHEKLRISAFKAKTIDTTGAGDAYDAGFVVAQLRGRSLKESAAFASAVAALKTTKAGARAALPRLAEVEKFMRHE